MGTCTKDPWTRAMRKECSLGLGVGWGKGEQKGAKWGQLKLNNNKKLA